MIIPTGVKHSLAVFANQFNSMPIDALGAYGAGNRLSWLWLYRKLVIEFQQLCRLLLKIDSYYGMTR